MPALTPALEHCINKVLVQHFNACINSFVALKHTTGTGGKVCREAGKVGTDSRGSIVALCVRV